jgi:chemotaxis protein methyltransferase CheR
MIECAPASEVQTAPDPYLIRIRDLIYQVAGIFYTDNKLRLLSDRCGRRMNAIKVATCREYLAHLTPPATATVEITKLLNEITIGETCFFRNQPQLDALKGIVWPNIMAARADHPVKRMRIWSAGCSTGEEPYTLAIMLLEETYRGAMHGWSFEIRATDLNERSLAHANEGVYDEYSVRNVTPQLRQKYFRQEGDKWRVAPEPRRYVNFSRLNLSEELSMSSMRSLDLIFCANVLIYFDLASKRKVIQHFYESLMPHGYFFLGHSESLYGVHDQFRLVHFPAATAYAKSPPPGGGK